jgi:anti-anti-sigma factor
MTSDLAKPTVVRAAPRTTVRLMGELDLLTQQALRDELRDVIDLEAPAEVIIDLTGVTFMDCSALASLIEARAHLSGRLFLHEVPAQVARLLALLGLDDMLLDLPAAERTVRSGSTAGSERARSDPEPAANE